MAATNSVKMTSEKPTGTVQEVNDSEEVMIKLLDLISDDTAKARAASEYESLTLWET